jgi:hypothetical protein
MALSGSERQPSMKIGAMPTAGVSSFAPLLLSLLLFFLFCLFFLLPNVTEKDKQHRNILKALLLVLGRSEARD